MASADGTAAPGAGREYGLRVAVFYAALFLLYGVHVPYLPVWLDWRGLTPSEVAAVMSIPFFARLVVTPSVALLADRSSAHRSIVIGLGWAALVFALLLSQMHGFWLILMTAVPLHIASSTIMPLTETVAVRGVKAANLDYGRMRLWGSLTFIAVGLIGGVLMDAFGPPAALWLIVVGALATAAASHLLPRPMDDLTPRAEPSAAKPPSLIGREAFRLVREPIFIAFIVAVGLIQATHGTFYTFGALHWRAQGLSTAWVGALWAVAVLAEVLLFAYSRAVVQLVGPVMLVVAGAAAAVARWSIMSLDPPLAVLVPLQALHGLTYGASHLGAMHFISRAVPDVAAGTAQALYATFAAGVFMGTVTLLSGPIYAAHGGSAYLVPSLLALLGLGLSVWLKRAWSGGELWAGR